MTEIKPSPVLVISIILSFVLLLSLFGFYSSIRPPKIISNISPADLDLVYEEVSFITNDGIILNGWFIPNIKNEAKTLILLHGYPADKGDILPSLSFLNSEFNLLLFDFRSMGESEGKISTVGARETEDLLTAIRFLKDRGIEEVGVWGFSLGGAVAMMTCKKAPEIKAIVSESSYARLDLMTQELYRIPGLKYPLGYLTGVWSKIFLGISIRKVSPVESIMGLEIPILVIHSKNDQVIPFEHALLIQETLRDNPNADFWFEENLFHGQLAEDYNKRILKFFKENL
ncbi:MAG: alpha/beta fold hydrolase [Candidatus Marinimicrobia bacterium]|nr:alpha/beta fold hydrolase [Candidatus Neomarinimicrobiota bacterium]